MFLAYNYGDAFPWIVTSYYPPWYSSEAARSWFSSIPIWVEVLDIRTDSNAFGDFFLGAKVEVWVTLKEIGRSLLIYD